jgi:hypothetical protein
MTADLRLIIADLASRADDFLAEARERGPARAGIAEELSLSYPDLDGAHRAAAVAGVMSVLEEEDFFGIEFCGDAFAEDAAEVD